MTTDTNPISTEVHGLTSIEPPAWCKAVAAAERFAIRTLRVIGAIAIGGIAIWLFSIANDVLSKPFASLSPLALVGGILAGAGGLLLVAAAFGVAFGPKGHSRIEAAWRESQGNTVQTKRRLQGYDT